MNPHFPKEIYLDYAASTPVDRDVVAHMAPFFDRSFGNSSSLHVQGRRSRKVIEDARNSVAKCIGVRSSEIIFTGSGTEANNMAIIGTARAYKHQGNHIIVSAIEHKSILEAVHVLEGEGFRISVAPVTKYGILDVEACLSLITDATILISVMLVNNELGSIQPVRELANGIAKIKKNNLPLFHSDACQAMTLLSVRAEDLGVDMLTINSSKVYGPNGVGLLYKKHGVILSPILVGGGQEKGLRAGTESVPLIAGFAKALELAYKKRDFEYGRLQEIRVYVREELKKRIPQVLFNGDEVLSIPSIIHITIPSIEGESMLLMLDTYGICVSTGSACSATDLRPSYVLTAIGVNEELIHGSLRISLGRYTTKEDVDYFLEVFPNIVTTLTKMSPVGFFLGK